MPLRVPALRVNHLSIAVREIAPALARLRRILPITMGVEPRPGYDDQFNWTDFFVGDWKLELIESARPGSFVERFLARRGEGPHHLSIDVEDGALDTYSAALEQEGLRIVDRGDYGDGEQTAFISPRTSPGILVQFWQIPGFRGARPVEDPSEPIALLDGIRFRVDHLALAVRSIDDTLAWFRRFLAVEVPGVTRSTRDEGHSAVHLRLAGYEIALIEPSHPESAVAHFLGRRGEGFHHVAIDVDGLDRLATRLGAEGIRLRERMRLADGREAAFVDADDTHGLLLRFQQDPDLAATPRR